MRKVSILIRLLLFHLILIVFQSYELKENMSPMKEDLLKCKKEVKKVDSVKRAGSKRSIRRRKRLREASGSFFKIASLRKEAAGKGESGVKKTKERSRRGEDDEAVREKEKQRQESLYKGQS